MLNTYALLNRRRMKAMADQITTVSAVRLGRRMGLLGRAVRRILFDPAGEPLDLRVQRADQAASGVAVGFTAHVGKNGSPNLAVP